MAAGVVRRSLAALAAATGLMAAPSAAQRADTTRVVIAGGVADGITHADGTREWRGLPFAAAPVRELRWRGPQPVVAWQGVLHADRFAPQCMQPLRAPSINHYFGAEATSEDCLYLNIWAPAPARSRGGHGAPVVVWIYGGGFNIGSASMPNYAGGAMTQQGVVQVNLAYRVGALGFLSHPELTREGGGASGNYGLMDQIAGLRWVKANIARFGGDPDNVTIMGQSAGSMSVGLLQVSPQARGLFRGVVAMSGAMFGSVMPMASLADAEAQGVALQQALGASSLADMRGMAADRVIATPTARGAIVIDGKILPATPAEIFVAHQQSDVPLMLGFTRDEAFRSLGPVADRAGYAEAIRRAFPATADQVLAVYPVADDAGVARAVADVQRDSSVGAQMAALATAQVSNGTAPVYAWEFSRVHPYLPGVHFSDHDPATVGAYHSGDVPYWLGTLDSFNSLRPTRGWTAIDRVLSARMMAAIIAFARGSAPAADWPRFDPAHAQVMGLGDVIGPKPWPHFADLPLFADAPVAPATPGRPRVRD